MYSLLRNVLFNFDAEDVHHFSMNAFSTANKLGFAHKLLSNTFELSHPSLQKEVLGLRFKNPVGLGAGFDKNALYLSELETVGFGFVEVGTVTPLAQPGNDRPRIFRLPKDKALINRMGFNNDGVKAVAARLRKRKTNIIIGGNIGKNKVTENEFAWKDYQTCFTELHDCVDYFVVNVSSPNTPGLRELQEKSSLLKIFSTLQDENQGKANPKPLLLKIAPDLTIGQVDDIIELAEEVKLSGLVATNTTISRDHLITSKTTVEQIGAGGLSGKPVEEKSTEIIKYIQQQTNGTIPIIASGGIFTGADAKEKLNAGASLIQVWTGFIYEGPGIVKKSALILYNNMHIKIALTEDIINDCLSLHYGRKTGAKKLKQRLIFIPAVLIIISVYLIYTEYQKTSPGPNLYLAILYIAFAIGYYLVMKKRILQGGKRLLKGLGENAEFEMEVDEEKLITKTKTGTITTNWSAFVKAIISDNNVLLYQQDDSFTMFNQSFFHLKDFDVFKTWTREKVTPVIEAPAV